MKSLSLHILLLATVGLLLSCAPAGENPERMMADAKALDQSFVEAYNAQDVDRVMALYWNSPDVVSYPPGEMEIRGWENMKQSFAKDFSTTKGGTLELFESNNKPAGDVVIGWGKWRWTMPMEQGPPMELTGRYTDVKAKRDGKWVYLIDHASAPMPPPPDPLKKM